MSDDEGGPGETSRTMTLEQRELYERLGKLARFIRRRTRYQHSSMHTVDVQQAAWLKLMVGNHSDTLEHDPKQLWSYAPSVINSILEDWRRTKSAMKRGDGVNPVSLGSPAHDSASLTPEVVDPSAEAKVSQSWAASWLLRELNAFIEGSTTAAVKDGERRNQMARAYWLHYVAGCTHEEIAATLELANKQVAWRYVDFLDRHLRRCAQKEPAS